MKILIPYVLVFVGIACNAEADNISIRVVNESAEPIAGAQVDISFTRSIKGTSKVYRGLTGEDGRFRGRGTIVMGAFVKVIKEGYYDFVRRTGFESGDHEVMAVMRKIEDPIPLFVRKVSLKFPVYDNWLGFDFEVGDWTAPHGKGKTRDILFKFHREFRGYRYSGKKLEKMRFSSTTEEDLKRFYGKWDAKFHISFLSDFEGIIEEEGGYLAHSEMKMPHLAPKERYLSEDIVIEKKSYRTKEEDAEEMRKYIKFGADKPWGYYIRTRVTEVDGKILKANYVKLPKKISVSAAGSISFTYYFNPTINDRNLEYVGGRDENLAIGQQTLFEP